MTPDNAGSVSCWIGHLRAGDQAAAQRLWERYFDRLVRLARSKLRTRRARAQADEEDVALSAFESLCRGVAAGRFPGLSDRDDLWRLLVTITARKAASQFEREQRQKRGGGRVLGEADLEGDSPDGLPLDLASLVGPDPSPESMAQQVDQYEALLNTLDDENLRLIALWKLEGYTNEEIARGLDCALRTVANKLKLIRLKWEEAP
jgi:DNA-directed RNA polymerase specialized sigma24 family protein